MILQVDSASPVPPYEQIRSQIRAMVDAGVLAPGARLPSIRQLAGDLGLAGGTVARAYRELELEGVVTSRGRHGTVITDRRTARSAPAPRDARVVRAASALAAAAQDTDTDLDSAIAAVRAAFARLGARPAPGDLR
jgi:GntR family transcriptional regulator